METMKFRTNIKCSGCIAKASPVLNEAFGEASWHVDTGDPSKILTVQGGQDRMKVIAAVERAGYKAEAL